MSGPGDASRPPRASGAANTCRAPAASGRTRWLRFHVVGALGFAVQGLTLALLARWTSLPASVAVALAVHAAVTHNFLWHERYTWADRPRTRRIRRWAYFHLSTGLVSVVANVIVTAAVMRVTGWPVLAANLPAVLAAALANFAVSDRFVFRSQPSCRPHVRVECRAPHMLPSGRTGAGGAFGAGLQFVRTAAAVRRAPAPATPPGGPASCASPST